jgi:hypothetical protein
MPNLQTSDGLEFPSLKSWAPAPCMSDMVACRSRAMLRVALLGAVAAVSVGRVDASVSAVRMFECCAHVREMHCSDCTMHA